MTDLELTRRCAVAMGFPDVHIAHGCMGTPFVKHTSRSIASNTEYRPLHDDAQAMALVKKLGISIDHFSIEAIAEWTARGEAPNYPVTHDDNLNRAIVLCAANLAGREG